MSSTITALTSGGGLAMAGDTSGQLELKTNNGTTAVTIDTAQKATFVNDASISGLTVGKGAGAVSTNTAIGLSALQANTTASNNTAVGYQALYSNTTGIENTALGYLAGNANTTSADSTYIGYGAGRLATGTGNTIVGAYAGYALTTGTGNTFVGAIIGGSAAGNTITTGSKNTILGAYSGNQGGLDIRTASNYIVLSDGDGNPRAYWNQEGTVRSIASATDFYSGIFYNTQATRPYGLGIFFSASSPNNTTQNFLECTDSTNTKLFIYSSGTVSNRTGTYNTISDAKLKENIVDATPKLDKLMNVKVRNYNLIGDELKQIGFVAQELETIFPALIDNVPDLDENKQPTGEVTKGVKLTVMIPILVKAIQELKAEVDSLKQQLGK